MDSTLAPLATRGASVETIVVGGWSTSQCGMIGWETEVIDLVNGMSQDQVDKLVEPLLLLGQQLTGTEHTLHVTLLPVGVSSHITKTMVSSVQSMPLLNNKRVVIEDVLASPAMARSLPPLYAFTSAGQEPLTQKHDLGYFETAHFVMLSAHMQGLHEHFDEAKWLRPDAMIHLVKTADAVRDGGVGCTNFFWRDVIRGKMIVLRAEGGFVMTADADLLHQVSHGVVDDKLANQYTMMVRGPLRAAMRQVFHVLLVESVNAVSAFQTLQKVFQATGGGKATQGLLHGGDAALSAVSKDAVAPPRKGYTLLNVLASNAGRRQTQHSQMRLPHAWVDFLEIVTEMGGTSKGETTVFLGQAVQTSGLVTRINLHLTTVIGRLAGGQGARVKCGRVCGR
jgi:hypothetical protein